jgi:hypothetical protein
MARASALVEARRAFGREAAPAVRKDCRRPKVPPGLLPGGLPATVRRLSYCLSEYAGLGGVLGEDRLVLDVLTEIRVLPCCGSEGQDGHYAVSDSSYTDGRATQRPQWRHDVVWYDDAGGAGHVEEDGLQSGARSPRSSALASREEGVLSCHTLVLGRFLGVLVLQNEDAKGTAERVAVLRQLPLVTGAAAAPPLGGPRGLSDLLICVETDRLVCVRPEAVLAGASVVPLRLLWGAAAMPDGLPAQGLVVNDLLPGLSV